MSFISKIPHPLLTEPGTSQKDKVLAHLNPEAIKIDGRDVIDLLDFIHKFSGIVSYYDENLNTDNWRLFFEKSLPFLIARIHKFDARAAEKEYNRIKTLVQAQPEPENLKLLFDYIYYEIILPLSSWQEQFEAEESSFSLAINGMIKANLQQTLKDFVMAMTAASNYGIGRKSFSAFPQEIWGLAITDLYTQNPAYNNVPGGVAATILALKDTLDSVYNKFIEVIKSLSQKAPAYFTESLLPLQEEYQKKHAPHLGLLFAFIRLFNYLQQDLNQISKKHLDYFYKDILNIKTREATPDSAHMVLELQKQVDEYLLKAGTQLKDGKDLNKKDILFKLDTDIIVDKAQVCSLKTLFLNHITAADKSAANNEGCDESSILCEYVEGAYIAPVANSADGIGENKDTASWFTIGSKDSKFTKKDELIPEPHPDATIGFVLASPVLLLNEGERVIDVVLTCSHIGLPDVDCWTECEEVKELLSSNAFLSTINNNKQVFNIFLSGAEEWLPVETSQIESISFAEVIDPEDQNDDGVISCEETRWELKFKIKLEDDFAPVTFFNAEVLKEDLSTEMPAIKILVNPEIKINTLSPTYDPCCKLERCQEQTNVQISMYHYLRHLKVEDTCINVEVCGVKNLIVQNDDNVQDVNELIFPFGTRPFVNEDDDTSTPSITNADDPRLTGSNFYIGSKEILCKQWSCLWLNINWHEKPNNFQNHYKGYQDISKGIDAILDDKFMYRLGLLEDNEWRNESFAAPFTEPILTTDPGDEWKNRRLRKLFKTYESDDAICKTENKYQQRIEVNKDEFPNSDSSKDFDDTVLTRLLPDTRDGFMRLTLRCQDFQHKRYPFVLARQMMAFGKLGDAYIHGAVYIPHVTSLAEYNAANFGISIEDIIIQVDQICDLLDIAKPKVDVIVNAIRSAISNDNFEENLAILIRAAIENDWDALGIDTSNPLVVTLLNNIRIDIETELEQFNGILRITDNIRDNAVGDGTTNPDTLPFPDKDTVTPLVYDAIINELNARLGAGGLIKKLSDFVNAKKAINDGLEDKGVVIPNEPWTPVIKDFVVDYKAKANKADIQLIHLYPFENTHKAKPFFDEANAALNPALLPTHTDEGTLYIGLEKLIPGASLNLLFQLAEATANSEAETLDEEVKWHYLKNNSWDNELRSGFEIVEDNTSGLRRSGIIKIATPEDIVKDGYTIMPKDKFWIKASMTKNVETICETIAIHTQAVKATYDPGEENKRDIMKLDGGSLAKLAIADANIKKVNQHYETFDGKLAEPSDTFYQRISERLRHKGRAINIFDYERIVLEHFKEIMKVRCITHTLGLPAEPYIRDLELAPGFVTVAVIPDLALLKAGNVLTPRAPLSLLEEIRTELKARTTPFARLKVLNPRYEKVHVRITFNLKKGKSNKPFYTKQLEKDIIGFLAPWMNGTEFDQLCFGRKISRSDLIHFVECLDYVDYICYLDINHQDNFGCNIKLDASGNQLPIEGNSIIYPSSARSILTAGPIEVCVTDNQCEKFYEPTPLDIGNDGQNIIEACETVFPLDKRK